MMNAKDKYRTLVHDSLNHQKRMSYESKREVYLQEFEATYRDPDARLRPMALSAVLNFIDRVFRKSAVEDTFNCGSLQRLFDSNVLETAASLFYGYENSKVKGEASLAALPGKDAIYSWYESIFLRVPMAEAYWFDAIRSLMDGGLLEIDYCTDEYNSMLDCMGNSFAKGKLLSPYGCVYSDFFTDVPPDDSIARMSDLYIKRVIGPSKQDEDDFDEPAAYMPYTVYPVEILAYRELVKRYSGIELPVAGTMLEPFANASYERVPLCQPSCPVGDFA
jgi:hypothetical protein